MAEVEDLGVCALCGHTGKVYMCKLCRQNVCIYCTSFHFICKNCARGIKGPHKPLHVHVFSDGHEKK